MLDPGCWGWWPLVVVDFEWVNVELDGVARGNRDLEGTVS